MRNTKRFFISLFIAIFTMSILAGCGGTTAATSGTTATTESKDKEPVVINSNGEGAVQGGIKSDEEITALQEEEAAFAAESEAAESDQPAEFEDNSGHEPEAYGSGNFQDYWEGEDYFDLVKYLEDNGYHYIFAYDLDFNVIKDGHGVIDRYDANSTEDIWEIVISYGYIYVGYVGGDVTNPVGGHNYTGYSNIRDQRDIIVDDYGTRIGSNTITALSSVVENIKSDPSNMDPMRNSGLQVDAYD